MKYGYADIEEILKLLEEYQNKTTNLTNTINPRTDRITTNRAGQFKGTYSEKRKRLEREKERRERERERSNYLGDGYDSPDLRSLFDFMSGLQPDRWTGVPGGMTREQDAVSAQIRGLMRTSYKGDEGFKQRQEKIDSLTATLRALQGVSGEPVKKRKLDISEYQNKYEFDFIGKDKKGNYIYTAPDIDIISNLSLKEKNLLNQYLRDNVSPDPSHIVLSDPLPQHLLNSMREKSKLSAKEAFNKGLFDTIKSSLSAGIMPQMTQQGPSFAQGRSPQMDRERFRSAEYMREIGELGDLLGEESRMEREKFRQGKIGQRATERMEKPPTPKPPSYYYNLAKGDRETAEALQLMDETGIILPEKIDMPDHEANIRSKNAAIEGEGIYQSIKKQFGKMLQQGMPPDEVEKLLLSAAPQFIEAKRSSGLKFKYNSSEYLRKLISRAKYEILYAIAKGKASEPRQ